MCLTGAISKATEEMKDERFDRRNFLKRSTQAGLGITAACGLGFWLRSRSLHPGQELAASQVRNYRVEFGNDLPKLAVVSGGTPETLAAAALAVFGGMKKFVSRGDIVVLKPNIGWQMPAYALLSAGEVMVSITALEFAYTQSPRHMKSIVMALYLLSVSAGNAFTALVHWFIANPDGTLKLQGASYYNFFAALSIGCVAVFVFVARAYKEQTYLQGDTPVPLADAASET